MRLPVMKGMIDRRILANFHIDPEVLAPVLPPPFKPQLIQGKAIGGICLIRLREERPAFLPAFLGLSSENAAHRFAVEWEEQGTLRTGVYIPRRDTSSRLNTFLGGRFFPGEHHLADFDVVESETDFRVGMKSRDSTTSVFVEASISTEWEQNSVFASVGQASEFFNCGSLGYSDTCTPGTFDGLELKTFNWKVESLKIKNIESSYFMETRLFPPGSVEFDCGLLMRKIEHEWHGKPTLRSP